MWSKVTTEFGDHQKLCFPSRSANSFMAHTTKTAINTNGIRVLKLWHGPNHAGNQCYSEQSMDARAPKLSVRPILAMSTSLATGARFRISRDDLDIT
jgi:hypothetical protein